MLFCCFYRSVLFLLKKYRKCVLRTLLSMVCHQYFFFAAIKMYGRPEKYLFHSYHSVGGNPEEVKWHLLHHPGANMSPRCSKVGRPLSTFSEAVGSFSQWMEVSWWVPKFGLTTWKWPHQPRHSPGAGRGIKDVLSSCLLGAAGHQLTRMTWET